MATSNKTSDQYNDKKSMVVKDLIWKDHISKIETAQKFYDRRWGFLSDVELQNSLYDPKRLPDGSYPNSHSSSTIARKDHKHRTNADITITPSPRPIPLTTNKLIGWRTSDKNCMLEKYGKYARGQESLHKKFKWPVEGFD